MPGQDLKHLVAKMECSIIEVRAKLKTMKSVMQRIKWRLEYEEMNGKGKKIKGDN